MLSNINNTIEGICLALSAGTFIYISCAEIIIEEFSISKFKFPKFLAYCAGILFIVVIGLIE